MTHANVLHLARPMKRNSNGVDRVACGPDLPVMARVAGISQKSRLRFPYRVLADACRGTLFKGGFLPANVFFLQEVRDRETQRDNHDNQRRPDK